MICILVLSSALISVRTEVEVVSAGVAKESPGGRSVRTEAPSFGQFFSEGMIGMTYHEIYPEQGADSSASRYFSPDAAEEAHQKWEIKAAARDLAAHLMTWGPRTDGSFDDVMREGVRAGAIFLRALGPEDVAAVRNVVFNSIEVADSGDFNRCRHYRHDSTVLGYVSGQGRAFGMFVGGELVATAGLKFDRSFRSAELGLIYGDKHFGSMSLTEPLRAALITQVEQEARECASACSSSACACDLHLDATQAAQGTSVGAARGVRGGFYGRWGFAYEPGQLDGLWGLRHMQASLSDVVGALDADIARWRRAGPLPEPAAPLP